MHDAIDNPAEEVLALVGYGSDEVAALGGVVVAEEADGAAVMGGGIVDHVVIVINNLELSQRDAVHINTPLRRNALYSILTSLSVSPYN